MSLYFFDSGLGEHGVIQLRLVRVRLVRGFRLGMPGDLEVVVAGKLVGRKRMDLRGSQLHNARCIYIYIDKSNASLAT
jgi:hypothetical protein